MVYAPGTLETDPKKQNMALQQQAKSIKTNTSDISTNTANIATNTSNIATNTANIATNTANIATNTTNIATNTSNISTLQTKASGYEAAWTTYAPTITASSGTFTSVSAAGSYLAIGKLVHFTVTITITTVGTASGAIVLPLPTGTLKRDCAATGTDSTVGKTVTCRMLSGASSGTIAYYDNTSAIVAGHSIIVTGIYEAA